MYIRQREKTQRSSGLFNQCSVFSMHDKNHREVFAVKLANQNKHETAGVSCFNFNRVSISTLKHNIVKFIWPPMIVLIHYVHDSGSQTF